MLLPAGGKGAEPEGRSGGRVGYRKGVGKGEAGKRSAKRRGRVRKGRGAGEGMGMGRGAHGRAPTPVEGLGGRPPGTPPGPDQGPGEPGPKEADLTSGKPGCRMPASWNKEIYGVPPTQGHGEVRPTAFGRTLLEKGKESPSPLPHPLPPPPSGRPQPGTSGSPAGFGANPPRPVKRAGQEKDKRRKRTPGPGEVPHLTADPHPSERGEALLPDPVAEGGERWAGFASFSLWRC